MIIHFTQSKEISIDTILANIAGIHNKESPNNTFALFGDSLWHG